MDEKAKQGDLITADDNGVRLVEALSVLAKPFAESQTDVAKTNAEAQIELQREHTKQMQLQIAAAAAAERRTSWQGFTVIGLVLLMYAIVLGFGLHRDNITMITVAISGVLSFVGGIGVGRSKK